MRFATKAVHAGLEPDPGFGDVIPAIHQSTTFAQAAPGEYIEDFDYSRSANPTRAALERALGELDGGLACAFSSGMAAEHALITAVCSAGDHVVIPDDLYGGTYRLVDKVLRRWGLEYTMVDQTDLDAVEAAVLENTRLVWVETPTNPTASRPARVVVLAIRSWQMMTTREKAKKMRIARQNPNAMRHLRSIFVSPNARLRLR